MRSFRRYPPWSVWVGLILCATIAARYWLTSGNGATPHASEGSVVDGKLVTGEFALVRVERADLLIVRQQVPVIGKKTRHNIEAPLQLLGVKAVGLPVEGKQFSNQYLLVGKPSLDLDRRRLDSAGHFLGYVYVDGKLLNEELIRAGLAQADLYPGDNQSMHRSFISAEKEARRAGRGIWAKTARRLP